MIEIDGSFGEGGGQILRSSLALSMVTGKPVRIDAIRARRDKPGLRPQHLAAVRAAAQVSGARVEGDTVGSSRLSFSPGKIAAGEYRFNVGTAGSTTLVLQTVLLPLVLADAPSRLTIEGGTHNPFAPPFDFLEQAYLPLLNRMGPTVAARLERPGFYPAGGGRMVVEIEPASSLRGFELLERGALRRRSARVLIANLPMHIAEREWSVLRDHLQWNAWDLEIQEIARATGPGNVVTIRLDFENVTEVFIAFGKRGRPAEAVATDAIKQCRAYLENTAPVGVHLTDQLMLPLAAAGSGAFASTGLSLHADTHIALIQKFLDVGIAVEQDRAGDVIVRIGK